MNKLEIFQKIRRKLPDNLKDSLTNYAFGIMMEKISDKDFSEMMELIKDIMKNDHNIEINWEE